MTKGHKTMWSHANLLVSVFGLHLAMQTPVRPRGHSAVVPGREDTHLVSVSAEASTSHCIFVAGRL